MVHHRVLKLSVTIFLLLSNCWAANEAFIGKWKLDPGRSKLADQMTIKVAGENRYTVIFAGTGEIETVTADGTDQAGIQGTTISITIEAPGTWKIVRKKGGRVLLSAIWRLSADGTTLTDAFTADPDGSASTLNMTYKRTAGDSGIPGTWECTDMKLESAYEMEIRANGEDGLSIIAEGSTQNIKFEDKEHPQPNPNGASGTRSSWRRVNERTLETTRWVKGAIVETRQTTVSPDLKTLTMTSHLADQREPNILVFGRE